MIFENNYSKYFEKIPEFTKKGKYKNTNTINNVFNFRSGEYVQ